ncbi:hypothetical protein [Sphaerisporangium sp. TRM90804]|uniref:hypothetical protein n=1 Tax=Sphaerisporangium sp. TRM90804 TaxID=3031113 RepID=UPI00244BD27B|nr:hypothetical protein [Sphaerisporangium sp. TRM90804]MDH2425715.1 hypothetical protein [Sphaerisporangium sp. TRM90804]
MRRTLVAAAVAAALFAANVAVQRATPSPDQRYAPIASRGGTGHQVDTTTFQLRVDRVQPARTIRMTDPYGLVREPRSTPGIWVVVSATVAATTETFQAQGARLRTRAGLEYEASSVLDTLDKVTLQPGIPVYGPLLFEIPARDLAGAVLSVTRHADGAGGLDVLGPAVEVDLGLSDAYASRLLKEMPSSLTVGQVREL